MQAIAANDPNVDAIFSVYPTAIWNCTPANKSNPSSITSLAKSQTPSKATETKTEVFIENIYSIFHVT